MGTSRIANSVSYHYDKVIKAEGTLCYIYSGALVANAYGETIPSSLNRTGSYIDYILFTPLSPEQWQHLPEGNRTDDTLNAFFRTGSDILLGTQLAMSGTTREYEVIQVTDILMAGNEKAYNKTIVRRL